jgi:acyl-coenzyme A synthetase/AMP-(fatty) acid ligase
VVLKPGDVPSEDLEKEIQAFVKEKIAPYKYPRWIAFTQEIPKTPGGNVQRFVLQESLKKGS